MNRTLQMIWAGLVTGIGMAVIVSCGSGQPHQDEQKAEAAPVVINKEAWSPTYRAARELGYEPKAAQAFSNLCKASQPEHKHTLCVDPANGKESNERQFAINVLAVKIVNKALEAGK